jgi:hypothetical protein
MDELKLYNSLTDTVKIFNNDIKMILVLINTPSQTSEKVKMKTNRGNTRIWTNCGQKNTQISRNTTEPGS